MRTIPKIKTGIMIKVRCANQFKRIQNICFDNNIYWKSSGECYHSMEDMGNWFKWISIRDILSCGGVEPEGQYPKDLEEVDADLFIRTNGTCVEDVYDDSLYFTHKKLIEILTKPTYKINCDLQKEDSEYLIFVEGKFKPSKIHTSLDEAEKEARRLCEKEMKEVHILKSVKRFKPKITIEEI